LKLKGTYLSHQQHKELVARTIRGSLEANWVIEEQEVDDGTQKTEYLKSVTICVKSSESTHEYGISAINCPRAKANSEYIRDEDSRMKIMRAMMNIGST
jgi:hypothetical protein